MRSTLGPATATTATAHTLATILSHMLQEKTPYRERGAEAYLHKDHARQLRQLRKQAQPLGCALVPHTSHEHPSRSKRREQRRQTLLQSTRADRAIEAPYVRCSARSLESPGSETDVPLVALSPFVRVVPSAHGCVTGEAPSVCWAAIP